MFLLLFLLENKVSVPTQKNTKSIQVHSKGRSLILAVFCIGCLFGLFIAHLTEPSPKLQIGASATTNLNPSDSEMKLAQFGTMKSTQADQSPDAGLAPDVRLSIEVPTADVSPDIPPPLDSGRGSQWFLMFQP